jgi:hypothetical protein
MGGMKKQVWIVLVGVLLVGVAGFAVASVISAHREKAEHERTVHQDDINLERVEKENEDLGRDYARTELKLFEGRNFRNRADGRPSQMITALAAISDPNAPIKPGSDLERWLRLRFKRSGPFSPDEVRQVAEEEVDRDMLSPAAVRVTSLKGVIEQGLIDLREGGEEALIPVFGRELQRLYGDQYSRAIRDLQEKKD